jgi:HEAT repeat protein
LCDLDDGIREKSGRYLKQVGEEAIPGLIEALEDEYSETRYIAARTLGELRLFQIPKSSARR